MLKPSAPLPAAAGTKPTRFCGPKTIPNFNCRWLNYKHLGCATYKYPKGDGSKRNVKFIPYKQIVQHFIHAIGTSISK